MARLLPNPNLPPPNLFTPDFGQHPHLIVGRDRLLGSLRQGFGSGPQDSRFITLLLGPRSTGKTVVLNAMSDAARESGWIVLPLDASTEGIRERISEHIEWIQDAEETVPHLSGGSHESRQVAKIKLPVLEWQREIVRQVGTRWSLRRQLSTLAEHASRHDVAVLLVIDELHGGERNELRRLAADLQHISKSANLPLAFLGAGLSEMKHTLLEDNRLTFFQRCNREDMPPLTSADALHFLAQTVRDASGTFEGAALERLATASGTLPFRMQLLGHYAWLLADAPINPIDDSAVSLAIQQADQAMHEKVAAPTWYTLSGSEQEFMSVLASFDGVASPQQIAAASKLSPSVLSRIERHLLNAGNIVVGRDGLVRLGDVVTRHDIRQILEQESRYQSNGDEQNEQRHLRNGAGSSPRCNAMMPRAKARCALPKGHAGGHRSR